MVSGSNGSGGGVHITQYFNPFDIISVILENIDIENLRGGEDLVELNEKTIEKNGTISRLG